jgi:hypothetical protein
MDDKKPIEQMESLRDKYLFLSRYLKTPVPIWMIKLFNWVCLIFSAFGTSFFLHWGLTAPLTFTKIDIAGTAWAIQVWGFLIVWPVFIVAFIVGVAFSVTLYASSYDTASERVHDRSERKSRKWFQSIVFFETSWDVLFIRLTGVAGMIMLSYGAVQNFNDLLAKDAEIKTAQKADLNKYQDTAEIIDKIEYWTNRKVNGKKDDDEQAEHMLVYYQNQLSLYNHRADSLNKIVYNKANIKTLQAVDVTASIKFISKGDKYLSGLMLLILLAIIALANDGSAVRLTRIQSRFDQANQAKQIYYTEQNKLDVLIYGNPDGNSGGNSGGKWMESGSGANNGATSGGGKESLETDLARAIIYAHAKDPRESNRGIARALGCSHTQVNDVLNAWRESNKKEETVYE